MHYIVGKTKKNMYYNIQPNYYYVQKEMFGGSPLRKGDSATDDAGIAFTALRLSV